MAKKRSGWTRYVLTIFKDRHDEWRWHLKSVNGQIVACSGEGYTRRTRAVRMTQRLFPWIPQS